MSAYQANFTGTNGTDLSSYTSDSSHTHTKHAGEGSGAIQIQSNALRAVNDSNAGFYTASYTPPSATYELEFNIEVNDLGAHTLGMGIHCETDGDGIFVFFNGFSDALSLTKVVAGSETSLDTFGVSDPNTYNVRMRWDSGSVQWWVDDADQGTHSLGGDLADAGLIGFTKFHGGSGSDVVNLLDAAVDELGGGGGPSQRFRWRD